MAQKRDLAEIVRKMYVDQNMSIAEIGQALHATWRTLSRCLNQAGVVLRPKGPRDSSHRPPRMVFRYVEKQGYVRVWRPEHHRANKKGFVLEHILVAELKIGRPILRHEDVHHLDENKANNQPENLAVFPCRADHIRHHNLVDSSAR